MLSYWVGELHSCPRLWPSLDVNFWLFLVDYGMSYVKNEAQFRFPLALQILFAIVTFLGIMCLPESPRWVCQNTFKFVEHKLTG